MGCGKSSVGRELSKLLCCPFMDLDDVIEERSGRRIPEIFATDGEAEFRRMEKDALELVFNTQEIRQSAPLAPSHFVGPSPYPGWENANSAQMPYLLTRNGKTAATSIWQILHTIRQTLLVRLFQFQRWWHWEAGR